jgi:phospholipid transport system substrate-binding protein
VIGLPRRLLLAGAVMLPVAALAEAPPAPAVPVAALLDALMTGMRAGKATPFATRAAKLRPAIEGCFDLRAILQASVGLRWAGFTPAQQASLLDAFREFTVATWVANFDTDDGGRFELLPGLRAVGSDQVVATRIVPKDGDPTRLDYVMRQTPAGWRAVDILVEGSISRVAVQRSDFRALLSGGDPAPLIDMLKGKATGLAH